MRAARAARLFFLTQPIKFLIYGVVVAVPVVDAKTPYLLTTLMAGKGTITSNDFYFSLLFARIMVRSSYYLVFGLLSLSNQQGSKPSMEEVVQFLSQQVKVKSSVKAIWSSSAKADLLKMDSVSVQRS